VPLRDGAPRRSDDVISALRVLVEGLGPRDYRAHPLAYLEHRASALRRVSSPATRLRSSSTTPTIPHHAAGAEPALRRWWLQTCSCDVVFRLGFWLALALAVARLRSRARTSRPRLRARRPVLGQRAYVMTFFGGGAASDFR